MNRTNGRPPRHRARALARVAAESVGVFVLVMASVWSWGVVGAAAGVHDEPPADVEGSAIGLHVGEGRGTSMAPTLPEGSTAVCVEGLDVEEGDVVVVEGEAIGSSHDVRHRVVEERDDTIVTKGDANDYRDDPVDRGDVVCRVVWAEGAGWSP
jgi:hypothetical protein